MSKRKDFHYEQTVFMSYDDKVKIAKSMAKRANVRLKSLEENNYTSFAYKRALDDTQKNRNGKPRFFEGTKYNNEDAVDKQLQALDNFLNAKSSTVGGIHRIESQRVDAFRAKGLEINNPEEFNQFLYSKQFSALKGKADSNQILEHVDTMFNEGFSVEEIQRGYEEFMNSEMTEEQVLEKLLDSRKKMR